MRKCDRRMLRYMAELKWQDGVSSKEVAKRCGLVFSYVQTIVIFLVWFTPVYLLNGLEDILETTRQGRLQWFGHVRREGEEGVFRMVDKIQVTGN